MQKPYLSVYFTNMVCPKPCVPITGLHLHPQPLGGLSRLSSWWVRLGIRPERIEKGKPNQNGRHERMHRSLKDGAINPARYSIKAQTKKPLTSIGKNITIFGPMNH